MVQDTIEASVPMKVDPVAGRLLPGESEVACRPTYAKVVAGLRAIGQRTAPLCGSAGIQGALGGKALSSNGLLERLAEVAEGPLFTQPS